MIFLDHEFLMPLSHDVPGHTMDTIGNNLMLCYECCALLEQYHSIRSSIALIQDYFTLCSKLPWSLNSCDRGITEEYTLYQSCHTTT